ncbi:hypothetical protein E2C01_065457 [Portunus trituberculatus]|uniref:Uncharacterized protein n=1 Tax=Portunus trituberculatus TaxID=210409 RepID=A0A5B7HMM4_PORTR|nr:hypothetical protein [Portunus trituberculatus]
MCNKQKKCRVTGIQQGGSMVCPGASKMVEVASELGSNMVRKVIIEKVDEDEPSGCINTSPLIGVIKASVTLDN